MARNLGRSARASQLAAFIHIDVIKVGAYINSAAHSVRGFIGFQADAGLVVQAALFDECVPEENVLRIDGPILEERGEDFVIAVAGEGARDDIFVFESPEAAVARVEAGGVGGSRRIAGGQSRPAARRRILSSRRGKKISPCVRSCGLRGARLAVLLVVVAGAGFMEGEILRR